MHRRRAGGQGDDPADRCQSALEQRGTPLRADPGDLEVRLGRIQDGDHRGAGAAFRRLAGHRLDRRGGDCEPVVQRDLPGGLGQRGVVFGRRQRKGAQLVAPRDQVAPAGDEPGAEPVGGVAVVDTAAQEGHRAVEQQVERFRVGERDGIGGEAVAGPGAGRLAEIGMRALAVLHGFAGAAVAGTAREQVEPAVAGRAGGGGAWSPSRMARSARKRGRSCRGERSWTSVACRPRCLRSGRPDSGAMPLTLVACRRSVVGDVRPDKGVRSLMSVPARSSAQGGEPGQGGDVVDCSIAQIELDEHG